MSWSRNSKNVQDLYNPHQDNEIHFEGEEDRKPPSRLNMAVKNDGLVSIEIFEELVAY